MRLLIVLIIVFGAVWLISGGQLSNNPATRAKERRASVESRVCAAMQLAVAKDMDKLTGRPVSSDPSVADFLGSAWGKCNVTSDDQIHWSAAVTINIPHTDENGMLKPDTFYMGDVKIDPATGEAQAVSVTHN